MPEAMVIQPDTEIGAAMTAAAKCKFRIGFSLVVGLQGVIRQAPLRPITPAHFFCSQNY